MVLCETHKPGCRVSKSCSHFSQPEEREFFYKLLSNKNPKTAPVPTPSSSCLDAPPSTPSDYCTS